MPPTSGACVRCSVAVLYYLYSTVVACFVFGGVFVLGPRVVLVSVSVLAAVVFVRPAWKRLANVVLNCGDVKAMLMTAFCECVTPMVRRARFVRALQSPKVKWLVIASAIVLFIEAAGLYTMCWETPYAQFTYPLEVDARELLRALEDGRAPAVRPINSCERYRFKIRNDRKCAEVNGTVRLLLLVKSALQHRSRRDAIRRSWGFESRFSDVVIRRVFMLGTGKPETQDEVDAEYARHKDLVQADFIDAYYNNTIKTMLGFRWAFQHCRKAEFVLCVDDDYYVSVKNLLKFIRNPWGLSAVESEEENTPTTFIGDGRLWAGFVFARSRPMRHRWSKWYLSLDEYPFSRFPPYVTAGAFVLSQPALVDLYQVSQYTRPFRFDDIFLGIVARKAGLQPLHSDAFRFWGRPESPQDFEGLVAAHGFSDPELLVRVWEQQKSRGQA
ncbi:beta-1,3-galactosyltransferase brn [Dermacentor andersoni]|uniref:beta-1,3-galactosyltransferase brn n=1 Tax=Dermacentor andersoni TaxID=34620 RepID=UPI0021552975|nr:beta-1,3-galactosyltransferase brn-like [Dermacentor andersoni]